MLNLEAWGELGWPLRHSSCPGLQACSYSSSLRATSNWTKSEKLGSSEPESTHMLPAAPGPLSKMAPPPGTPSCLQPLPLTWELPTSYHPHPLPPGHLLQEASPHFIPEVGSTLCFRLWLSDAFYGHNFSYGGLNPLNSLRNL